MRGDCDDADANVGAGFEELCDELDNDCDEAVDEDFDDTDGNGVLDCLEQDLDGDGQLPWEGDCDNEDPDSYSGAPELCDGLDNDCNGLIPDGEADDDGDGWRICDGDCDDTDSTQLTRATWSSAICIDNNCDRRASLRRAGLRRRPRRLHGLRAATATTTDATVNGRRLPRG